MNRLYYDLHIHSCLSPCGDCDMTPCNIAGMAKLLGQDLIALTDHNTCRNCPAADAAARQAGLVFIPGMELCTSEEVHVVCLFPSLESAAGFDELVTARMPKFPNDPEKLGEQIIFGEDDTAVGQIDHSLLMASDISVDSVPKLVREFGGVAFPAHIDRPAFSVISSLGEFPDWAGYTAVEITASGSVSELSAAYEAIRPMPKLLDSDAHYLDRMNERGAWMEVARPTAQCVIDALLGTGDAVFSRG